MSPVSRRWVMQSSVANAGTPEPQTVLKQMKAAGLVPDSINESTPLTEAQQSAVRKSLEGWQGLISLSAPRTWGDAFRAATADVNRDGRSDVDLNVLTSAGLVDSTPEAAAAALQRTGVEVQDVLAAPAHYDPERDTITLSTQLVARDDGTFALSDGKLPEGGTMVNTVSIEGGSIVVGLQEFAAKWPLKLPGLPPEMSNALLDKLLAVRAPDGSSAADAQLRITQSKTFATQSTAPADRGEAVAWRAARIEDAQFQRMTQQLTERYGVRPLKYTGYINEQIEAPVAKAFVDAAKPAQGITPSFLYAVAMGEGLGRTLDAVGPEANLSQVSFSGFNDLGVDTFGSQVADLKRKLLLPASFTEGKDYELRQHQNELNQSVTSADFNGLQAGLTALNAMLADNRRQFLADARTVLGRERAAKLTPDQINLFTYVYFNAGPGFGRRQLEQHGVDYARKWTGAPPADNRVARYNAVQRVSTWRLVEGLKLFPS